MLRKSLHLKNLSLSFPDKTCFEDFEAKIHEGSFIAIIGSNGSGKTSLLKIIKELATNHSISCGYVEQIPQGKNLSGAQKFHKALTKATTCNPDLLLLDEPTNHLDSENRANLIYMLASLQTTLIIVSHDKEILRKAGIIWHVNNGKITEFKGNYNEYIKHNEQENLKIQSELSSLNKEQKRLHSSLMKEQRRAAKSKETGKKHIANKKWPTIVSKSKADRANATTGKKKANIANNKEIITSKLSEIYIPKKITPNFVLNAKNMRDKNILSVIDGEVGYEENKIIQKDISININVSDKFGIIGKNASGKTTILKAIMGELGVWKKGTWSIPSKEYIGYLDQHYKIINFASCPYDLIKAAQNAWNDVDIRQHLTSFLFRKNNEIYNNIDNLSGGEKARLSLALIGAKPVKLLLLDEVTNNLDLETKEHIIEILRGFPGALIAISHDLEFLERIGVNHYLEL